MPVVKIDELELKRNQAAKAASRAVRYLGRSEYELAVIDLETALYCARQAVELHERKEADASGL